MESSNEQALRLLQRIASGNEDALKDLHRQFNRRIYAFALNRLHDHQEAESIVVETLYDVWKNASKFRGESLVSTWILGIARYKILNVLRSRGPEHEEVDEAMPAGDLGVFDLVAQQQRREWVQHCMERLSDNHRECLFLVFYEGWSLAEIAKFQECSENTVKTRLFHARRNIKTCLERMLRSEGG